MTASVVAPLIELSNVSKEYVSGTNVVRALRDVNITIGKGEFVAIVGTSGSGKSTLMNILGCLDRPTHGTYKLSGIDVGDRDQDSRAIVRNRLIGFIFQGFNLLPRTTALENCELPLQYRGVAASERRRRAKKALDSVGLGPRLDHAPNQLSGGQQQRVAIARALVTEPPLLLADEPTGNLDTRTSYEVLSLLQNLNDEWGITIVLVTHERDIAACAKRIVTVRDGRVVADAPPEDRVDAAAELAKLGAPEVPKHSEIEEIRDPLILARRRLGGPVPLGVHMTMLLGAIVGAIVGYMYSARILGDVFWWIPAAVAIFAEAWFGAISGGRHLGRVLTPDQRARVAIVYTLVTVAAVLTVVALIPRPKLPATLAHWLAWTATSSLGLTVVVGTLLVASLALLRYLLLGLFSRLKDPAA